MGSTDIEANAVGQPLRRIQPRGRALANPLVHFGCQLGGDRLEQRFDGFEILVDGVARQPRLLRQFTDVNVRQFLLGEQLEGRFMDALLNDAHGYRPSRRRMLTSEHH